MKKILVINGGSSTIKFQLYLFDKLELIAKGRAEAIDGIWELVFNKKTTQLGSIAIEKVLEKILETLKLEKLLVSLDEIAAIGNRLVAGGDYFINTTELTEKNLAKLKTISNLAPLHNPPAIKIIDALKSLSKARQFAIFDTQFHATIAEEEYRYAVPERWFSKLKVRKYGFHGISYQYVTGEIAKILNKPINQVNAVICHLGNGASVTAIKNGKSINTSMGFTPLDGLIMGTRSGEVDASILGYVAENEKKDIFELTNILNKESGILALSQKSADFRIIEEAYNKGDKNAVLAVNMFVKRVAAYVIKYANQVGLPLDCLVFTAGIGENAELIRNLVTKNITLLDFKNQKAYNYTKVLVVPTNEEFMIAKNVKKELE